MNKLEKAKSTLVHYIREAFEAAGLKWGSDNVTEVEGIVDDMVAGIEKRREEQEKDQEETRARIRDAREERG